MDKIETPKVGLITIIYKPKKEEIIRFVENVKILKGPRLIFVYIIIKPYSYIFDYLSTSASEAITIEEFNNIGPAKGWNLGIKKLLDNNAKYIGIWNIDVQLHKSSLITLLKILEADLTIGAVSPLLFYSDEPNKVQMYGGSIDPITGIGKHDYNGETDLTNLPPIRDAQYLDGGTMLIRAEVFRKIGGFDEKLFMYYEDSDLCLRIQQAGYRTVAVRDAWAWHYHRENRGLFPHPYEIFYLTRNRFYFIHKHRGKKAMFQEMLKEILKAPRKTLFFIKHLKFLLAISYLQGLLYGIFLQMGKRKL